LEEEEPEEEEEAAPVVLPAVRAAVTSVAAPSLVPVPAAVAAMAVVV
jgi:hypothetical protein